MKNDIQNNTARFRRAAAETAHQPPLRGCRLGGKNPIAADFRG